MAKTRGTCVVTASRTDDGAPVYLGAAEQWVAELGQATPYPDEGAAQEGLAFAQRQERLVCDPYLMPVVLDNGRLDATTARERIRATGPTSRIRRPDPVRNGQ